ncbi:putative magnesium transporter NIPA4 [Forsythia ovata]|uniref:Probable magnesium transporter n=1 Tax=Forsythia ovata TaxID=205694 RepID=A0ABD1VF02_9LAMI
MGFSKDNLKGIVLALISCGFIGTSFIIKKKGLKKAAAASGVRAGVGVGYSYLGASMVFWHDHNAVLAHFILKEKLHQLGIVGCVMCIVGSIIIVIHTPHEQPISSVQEI